MLLLNKKRIIYIFFSIIISFFLFSYPKTIQTSSIPSSSHTIIIDAGHGNPDGGAISSDGTNEATINLSIALKIQKLLETTGSNVILTRSDENGIFDITSNNKKKSDLINRTKIANNSNAEIFISIHLNKIDISSCCGWQAFYQKNNEHSKKLAQYIQDNLNTSIQRNNSRTIMPLSNKYIMDHIKIPTVIIECGFLSNLEELNELKNSKYQEQLAWGIYTGILDYFSNFMI